MHRDKPPAPTLSFPFTLPTAPPAGRAVAFRVFDADEDAYVTSDDLLRWLHATNRRGLSGEQLEQIVGSTLAQFDEDGDGQLCYAEFRQLVCASSTDRNSAFQL